MIPQTLGGGIDKMESGMVHILVMWELVEVMGSRMGVDG